MNGFYDRPGGVRRAHAFRRSSRVPMAGSRLAIRCIRWNISQRHRRLLPPWRSVALLTEANRSGRSGIQLAPVLVRRRWAPFVYPVSGFNPLPIPLFNRQDLSRSVASCLKSGFFYYLLQVELMVIGGLDNIVISKIVGVEAFSSRYTASRFKVITLPFSTDLLARRKLLGRSLSGAVGHNDYAWIRTEGARARRLGTLWMALFSGGFAAVGVQAISPFGRAIASLRVDPLVPSRAGCLFCVPRSHYDRCINPQRR